MEVILYIVALGVGALLAAAILWRVLQRERSDSVENMATLRESEQQQAALARDSYERQLDMQSDTIAQLRAERDGYITQLNDYKGYFDSEKERLLGMVALLEKEKGALSAKVESLESAEKIIKENFEATARRVLEEKSQQMRAASREGLSSILEPLTKDIEQFKRQIEASYIDQTKQTTSLSSQLHQLMDLNRRLSDDALNLTRALKGEHNPKMQGDWGEMILDSVLSGSGLKEGQHYFLQESMQGEDGSRLRPDVVVRYPDGREIVIDSKVSLTAYSRYIEAEDDSQREQAATEHIISVRRHIDSLSSKEYHKRDASCDFVMMFMPIEPAYMLALGADGQLWDYAYKRKIVVVSPTHLITALKLVYDLWSRYDQSQNALKIASRGAELYDKFAGFVTDMNQIGKAIDNTKKQYDSAVNKLSSGKGNLVRQVEMLKELGVRATKEIAMQSKDEFEIPDEES